MARSARIVELKDEGRLVLSQLENPIGDKTHCLEFHRKRTGEDGSLTFTVVYVLLTHAELVDFREVVELEA